MENVAIQRTSGGKSRSITVDSTGQVSKNEIFASNIESQVPIPEGVDAVLPR